MGGVDNQNINDTYLSQAQEIAKNDTYTEEERYIFAYDVAESLFRQYSYELKFMHFDRDAFSPGKPVDQIVPFSCPIDFKQAEAVLMEPTYYAQQTDMEIIQEVFKVKVVALKQELEQEIVESDGKRIMKKSWF